MEEKPTQSREGVKGGFPLVGFGATPQLFLGRSISRTQSTKEQAAKRPCQ